VVLSTGVRREDFAAALHEACAGGAAGFLAGRAVWSDLAAAADPAAAFRATALPRLRTLAAATAVPVG
jgi:sulfofructosephosphate aldolase